MTNVALVVPTIRENCLRDFVKRWGDLGLFKSEIYFIVMEDNPNITFSLDEVMKEYRPMRGGYRHLSWKDIDADLGKDSWIIPRRSDTVRSFAYWWAWKRGFEYILTLDDDCYPPVLSEDGLEYRSGTDFVDEHRRYIDGRSRWFNTLNSVKPRGIPFYNTGKDRLIVVNHGLWTKTLDYDAPYQLVNPVKEEFSYDSRVVPAGLYFPMCGMNVMWRRHFTVAMYHLLMGQNVPMNRETNVSLDISPSNQNLVRLPFDRFGDIWCGIIMKKLADIMGYRVATGMPYIRHERASNPFTNLKKEANGIEVNETFWEHVDKFVPSSRNLAISEMYAEIGSYVVKFGDEYQKQYLEYFVKLGEAMQTWAALFKYDPEKGTSGV